MAAPELSTVEPSPPPLVATARDRGIALATWLLALGFAAWCALFIARSSFIAVDGERWFCLFDDAMISMRYAWNLAHGAGLVWNAGERVEGISNLLTTLLMAAFARFFERDVAVLCVQCAGVPILLVVGALSRRVGRAVLAGAPGADAWLIPPLCSAAGLLFYPLAYWTLMGMETGLVTLLLLLAVALVLDGARRPLLLGAVLGLLFLARPDASIPAALLLGYLALEHRRAALVAAALFFAVVVATTLFRAGYYGSALPNTFLLKASGMPLGFRLRDGMGFVAPIALMQLPALALAVRGCVGGARRRPLRLLLALHLAAVAYQVWVGGDAWPYWRMLAPTTPLLLLGALAGALELLAPFAARTRAADAAMLVILCALPMNRGFFREAALLDPPYQTDANAKNVSTAIVLRLICRESATVAVLYAGAIPYFTGLRALDLLGKSDRHIAALPPDLSGAVSWAGMKSVPGHNKYDLHYSIVQQRPTYVQTRSWGREDVGDFIDANYALIEAKGLSLDLLRGSPDVDWSLLGK